MTGCSWWPFRNLKSWKQCCCSNSLICVGGIWDGHCCGLCRVRRSCALGPWGPCFSSLMTAWMLQDPEIEPLEAQDRAKERKVGGKFQCSMFSIRVACLFRIILISLSFPTNFWVTSRFLSVNSLLMERQFSASSRAAFSHLAGVLKRWVLQPFPHPQILQGTLIREMSLKAALLNPAYISKSKPTFPQFLSKINNSLLKMSSS